MDQAELTRMNQVLRHRLRNVASGIKGAVTYLADELDDRLSREEKEYFPLIAKECDDLSQLTARLNLLFEPAPAGPPARLETVLGRLRESVGARMPEGALEVSAGPEALEVSLPDEPGLTVALVEVCVNAMEEDPDRTARLTYALENGHVRLEVFNRLRSAVEENLEKWTEPFYTSRPRNLGIGLAVANRILAGMGARLELRLEEGQACRAVLTVPRAA